MPTLDKRVAAIRDSISSVPASSYWGEVDPLYLIGNSAGMTTALRFTALDIPKGSTIVSAQLTVYANLAQSSQSNAWADVGAEQADNASQLSNYANHESRKTNVGDTVQWGPHAGISQHAAFTTPDLSDIVQTIIDRSGWASGNALQFFVTPNPDTTIDYQFWSYYEQSGTPSRLPRLEIEWTEGEPLTLTPNAQSAVSNVVDQAAGTTNLHLAVDEGVDTSDADTTYLVNSGRTSGSVTLALTDTPSDFESMIALTVRLRARRTT